MSFQSMATTTPGLPGPWEAAWLRSQDLQRKDFPVFGKEAGEENPRQLRAGRRCPLLSGAVLGAI